MRNFDTGATRNSDEGKYDYEAFMSPLVIERYAAYMHKNRYQADGKLRDGDNWQKGIPKTAYIKSAWRHFMDWWKEHRGIPTQEGLEQALCAILFNVMGYLHETLKEKNGKEESRGWRTVLDADESARQGIPITKVYRASESNLGLGAGIDTDEGTDADSAYGRKWDKAWDEAYGVVGEEDIYDAVARFRKERPEYNSAIPGDSGMEHG